MYYEVINICRMKIFDSSNTKYRKQLNQNILLLGSYIACEVYNTNSR